MALGLPYESEADSALTAAAPVAVACFRGQSTISVLVSKPECHVLQEKLRAARARAQPAEPSAVAVGEKRPAEEPAADAAPSKRASL